MMKANFVYTILGFLLLSILVFSVFAQNGVQPQPSTNGVEGDIQVEICKNGQVSTLVRKGDNKVYECVRLSQYNKCEGVENTTLTWVENIGEEVGSKSGSWECITNIVECQEGQVFKGFNKDERSRECLDGNGDKCELTFTINCSNPEPALTCEDGKIIGKAGDGKTTCVDSGKVLPVCADENEIVVFETRSLADGGDRWKCENVQIDSAASDVEECFIKVDESGESLTKVECTEANSDAPVLLRVEPNQDESGNQIAGEKVFGNLVYSGREAKNINLISFDGHRTTIPQNIAVNDDLERAKDLYPVGVPCGLGSGEPLENIIPCFDAKPGGSGPQCPNGFSLYEYSKLWTPYRHCLKDSVGEVKAVEASCSSESLGSRVLSATGTCGTCGEGKAFLGSTGSCVACDVDYIKPNRNSKTREPSIEGNSCVCPRGFELTSLGYCAERSITGYRAARAEQERIRAIGPYTGEIPSGAPR